MCVFAPIILYNYTLYIYMYHIHIHFHVHMHIHIHIHFRRNMYLSLYVMMYWHEKVWFECAQHRN